MGLSSVFALGCRTRILRCCVLIVLFPRVCRASGSLPLELYLPSCFPVSFASPPFLSFFLSIAPATTLSSHPRRPPTTPHCLSAHSSGGGGKFSRSQCPRVSRDRRTARTSKGKFSSSRGSLRAVPGAVGEFALPGEFACLSVGSKFDSYFRGWIQRRVRGEARVVRCLGSLGDLVDKPAATISRIFR